MEKSAFNPAFIIPYYNHPARIGELVRALAPIAPVLIVDDGSDETSKEALRGLEAKILTQPRNAGKGAALIDGFVWASELGFTHVLQIDADFQHDISGCAEFFAMARENPHAIIAGAPLYNVNAPKSRLYGRKITTFWCAINTLSTHIKDGMCGFRVYPLDEILPLCAQIKSLRMGFDIEILVLAVRERVQILWHEIAVNYDADGVSHFAPLRDNAQISLLHARLFFSLPLWLAKRLANG